MLRRWLWVLAAGALASCSGDKTNEESRAQSSRAGDQGKGEAADMDAPPEDPFGNGGSQVDAGATAEPAGPQLPADGCGAQCFVGEAGSQEMPFDLTNNPADGVGLDADGAIVLQRADADADRLIWIANTSEYTVSKVDSDNMVELARYEVAVNVTKNPSENGPSRTTIDGDGNLYAGARMGDQVSKVLAAGAQCPDTNGDGMVTTSSGPADVLPLGSDDCLVWSTDIGGDARGLALQEIPGTFTIEPQVDAEPIITETPAQRYLWVGGHDSGLLHKLDAETGQILLTIAAPTAVYGLALDGRGNLWISGRSSGASPGPNHSTPAIGRVDTTRCVDASCGSEVVCTTVCSGTNCPDTCDAAVLERIEGSGQLYGITVDCNQRVWLGGAHGDTTGVRRYDPLAAAATRMTVNPAVAGTNDRGIHGIAADSQGFVWAAARDDGVWRIDSDTMNAVQVAGTGGAEFSAKGIAVDQAGKVWAIPLRSDYAMVIEPGPTIDAATVTKPISGFVGPYTYSDMTGEQTRLAANEPGSYRQMFEGCHEDSPTHWRDLDWDVDVPMGTTVVFLARTANTVAELENAEWFTLTGLPGRDAPLEIDPFIVTAGQEAGKYIEIEVRLITTVTGTESTDGCTFTDAVSPRVKRFSVSHECEPDLG